MAIHHKAGAAMHHVGGKALAKHHRKGKKRGKKKAAKKSGKKKSTHKKVGKKRRGKKKATKKSVRRRRRKGQKGPNIISHTDPSGLGKGRVKCPAKKTAVATVAKHRRSGTYVFFGRCV